MANFYIPRHNVMMNTHNRIQQTNNNNRTRMGLNPKRRLQIQNQWKNLAHENRVKASMKRHIINKIAADSFVKKETYNSIIPLNIFQTWDNKHKLPPQMQRAVQLTKSLNPEFNHQIFTSQECLEFIRKHFDASVVRAYQRLIPAAYKADLWRYCVLYIHGGIYMDMKYIPNTNFSFMELTEAEHFVKDKNGLGVYNAFMVSLPKQPAMMQAIRKIVENVERRNYGCNLLDVTGPAMLAQFISPNGKTTDMYHTFYNNDIQMRVIMYKGKHILKCYPNYKAEQSRTGGEHYSTLWNRRRVFY